MNLTDYLFDQSSHLTKDFVAGTKEKTAFWALYRDALKLAHFLRKRHGQNKKILLAADNGVFFLTAYLAIIKSGNCCIPLDTSIEQQKFEFIKKKTRARMGFFSRRIKNLINPSMGCITESLMASILRTHADKLYEESAFDGDRLAEIIFTSGSTSEPKGVMLSHNNIIANTESILKYLRITEDDRMMVVLPFFYCYGLSLLHTHLRAGGSIVLNNSFIFLSSTIQDLNKYACTGFAGVPSHYQILLRKTDLFRKTVFPTMRYFTQAGGKLHNVFIDEFLKEGPAVPLYVMYGQTEATARLSYLPPDKLPAKMGSIGKGIPGVRLKVIKQNGQPVKPGEMGEICAHGKNVMHGYFEDPKETRKTIRNGWLQTGDLATVDQEGFIYLVARKKEMIKVGGNRVSPKEVESVIVQMKGVIDCSLEAFDDELLGEGIRAIVTINDEGKKITEDEIKQYCGTRLAPYKVPSYVLFKETMELSASGKRVSRQTAAISMKE